MIVRDMIAFGARFITKCKVALLVGLLGTGVATPFLSAQTAMPAAKPAPPVSGPTRYQPNRLSAHAIAYYAAVWGIDSLSVKTAESGELVRFTYQVLDADKARMLNDKTNNPFLISPAAGLRLSVPSLEKVGQLRQSSTPEPGKFYWMAFSNPGCKVKRGDRVDVVIGQFRAEGLVVE
jgi:hypothetical protein